MKKLFGTDGIRCKAGVFPLTTDFVPRIARAFARLFGTMEKRKFIVARDPRLSGEVLANAFISGLIASGIDVIDGGILPTPALSFLVRSWALDGGIMVSASHNLYEDNGLKFFDARGKKLTCEMEYRIESGVESDPSDPMVHRGEVTSQSLEAAQAYSDFMIKRFTSSGGVRRTIVVDCAHGAFSSLARQILERLGHQVISLNDQPDGRNINAGCGATCPEFLSHVIVEKQADIGVAFDGDGDRLIIGDRNGRLFSGDDILAFLAVSLKEKGQFKGEGVVSTIMANLGLERFLSRHGIPLIRTPVGDRFVMERMDQEGFTLGGEQSGHIITAEHPTGDGLFTFLAVLEQMGDRRIEQVFPLFDPCPQVLKNVPSEPPHLFLKNSSYHKAIKKLQETFPEERIVIRPSGTEPLLRIMVEGKQREKIEEIADQAIYLIQEFQTPSAH